MSRVVPGVGPLPGEFRIWLAPAFLAPPRAAPTTFEGLSADTERYGRSLADKRDGAVLFACAFQPGATTKSAAALDLAADLPPIVFADLDDLGPFSCARAVGLVAGLLPGVRADLWTTFNHDQDKPSKGRATRLRVLLPLTRSPSFRERALVWAAINRPGGLLGDLGPDQACGDIVRANAAPSAPVGRLPEYFRLPGGALDTYWLVKHARERGLAPSGGPRDAAASVGTGWVERPANVPLRPLTREDLLAYSVIQRKRYGAAAANVLAGRSIAAPGKRYIELRGLLASLWEHVRWKHGAWIDSASLWTVFGPTCEAMNAEGVSNPVTPTSLAALLDSFAGAGEAECARKSEAQRLAAAENQALLQAIRTARGS